LRAEPSPEIDYRYLFDHSPDAVFLVDFSGTIIDVNLQATRFLGYSADELIGSSTFDHVAPEQQQQSENRLRELTEEGFVKPAMRIFINKDGQRVPGEIFATAVELPGEDESLIFSAVRAVNLDLVYQREQEEQSKRLESLGRIASGVAHDLNNILSSIIGFAELAREALPADSDPHRDILRSLKAADQAKKLVSQILTFGRKSAPEPKPFDVEQSIIAIIRLIRSTLPDRVDLQFVSDHSRAVVKGDGSRLQQVVVNLCANAGKAIGNSRGVIRIRLNTLFLEGDRADEWGLSEGRYVAVSVHDDGPGIPPDIQEWIFEPFFSTRNSAGGTGLGLSIARGIVEEHGGSIRLEPSPRGAHFRLLLPEYHGDLPVEEP
jgi:PAS domain S-box-containing protein